MDDRDVLRREETRSPAKDAGRGRITKGVATPQHQTRGPRRMRNHRLLLALILATVVLGMATWLVVSINDLHERLAKHSPPIALAIVGLAVVAASASAMAAARLFWKLGQPERPPAKAPADVIKAAEL